MNFTVPGSCARRPGQHLGHAHQDRDVRVVAAGVHHADLLAVPARCAPCDANGRSTSSATGSASMSARSATTGPGSAPLSSADDAGVRDAGAHLVEAERAQVLGDDAGGADLAVAELGVLVDVAPPGDHLRLDCRCAWRRCARPASSVGGRGRAWCVARRRAAGGAGQASRTERAVARKSCRIGPPSSWVRSGGLSAMNSGCHCMPNT